MSFIDKCVCIYVCMCVIVRAVHLRMTMHVFFFWSKMQHRITISFGCHVSFLYLEQFLRLFWSFITLTVLKEQLLCRKSLTFKLVKLLAFFLVIRSRFKVIVNCGFKRNVVFHHCRVLEWKDKNIMLHKLTSVEWGGYSKTDIRDILRVLIYSKSIAVFPKIILSRNSLC